MRQLMAVVVLLATGGVTVHVQTPPPKPSTPSSAKPSAPSPEKPSTTKPSTPSAGQPSSELSPAATRDLNMHAYAELLRSDIRTQKVAIITEVVGFTEEEDKAFWPLYREYDAEMSKLGDQRVSNIEDYAAHFSNLTDEAADRIARQALELESQRQAVKAKYYDRFAKALSPRTALRVMQVEQQLLLLIDLQIVSSLPIAK
jgi:hypothetical protein